MGVFRQLGKLLRASFEAGKALSIDEYIEIETERQKNAEKKIFYRAIGQLTLGWGYVEHLFDLTNAIIITRFETNENELPRSLKPKISFYRRSFLKLPELSPFKEQAIKIADEANRLKEIRHDIIHGQAEKLTPDGLRHFIRQHHRGKELIETSVSYTLDQIIQANEEIGKLALSMTALVEEATPLFLNKCSKEA
ncbi:hypothetical protein [Tardiphaga sp. 11_C7_N12_6]|uniref:hypothetical protein n=1 Tax=Tardiphaga sp. 11_C7_N12_6 TaxID=3240789 RepID=UPI003F2654F3